MKKILFVLPWLAVGGLERMQVTLANGLVRNGYDVTILALQPEDDLKQQLDKSVHYIYKKPRQFPIAKRIPYIRHKFYDDGMWETRANPKKLYEYYVGNNTYDIEIGFFRGLAIKIISGSTNPYSIKIAWVHSDFKQCRGIANNFRSMQEVKRAYAKYDKIVCVSNQVRNSFAEVIGCKEKLATVYNMIPRKEIIQKSLEKCPEKKEKFTVLSVGRLTGAKGYDRLLEVAKRLKDDGKDFALWIIGDGNEREMLQEYIVKNQLDNVKLLGQQINPYCYMKQADLYVCSSRYEGYNLTVAEAIICETSVLSTACTGPCEILDNGRYGMIVENSEDGIYQGVKAFVANPDLVKEYQTRAVQRREFFNEEKILYEITELFEVESENYARS